MIKWYVLFTFCISITTAVRGQSDIPLGTWRTHYSYNHATAVALADERVYVGTTSGIFIYDLDDRSVSTITTADGLQDNAVTALAYDRSQDQIIIGYASGNLDVIVQDRQILNIDLVTNSQILGDKAINHIYINGANAFISTHYGVLDFDLDKLEATETYRELSASLDTLQVYQSVVVGDSLFIATQEGVMAANIADDRNLMDRSNWFHYTEAEGIPSQPVIGLVQMADGLIAAVPGEALYAYNSGAWQLLPQLLGSVYKFIEAVGDELYVVSDKLYRVVNEEITALTDDILTAPRAVAGDNNALWIADANIGLVVNGGGGYESILPSGPYATTAFRLKELNGELYALPGTNSAIAPGYYKFSQGRWFNIRNVAGAGNIVDAERYDGNLYFASAGYGLLRDTGHELIVLDESNSPLINADPAGRQVIVPAVTLSAEGLWVLNYGVNPTLHLYDEGSWQSFILSHNTYVDVLNTPTQLWLIHASNGILVFDKNTGETRYLNSGLLSGQVNTAVADRTGRVWLGTDRGVAVYPLGNSIFTGGEEPIIPVFDNRPLFRGEVVTAIAVDGGNRKWIGTLDGVWLFDDEADQQIYHFDKANSPLPSNEIVDIEVMDDSGEVFFATNEGIVSFRSAATEGSATHRHVKIFPNPVPPGFTGTIGISGLANDAIIKITDSAGRLIWQTRANGATASWDGNDYNGKSAAPGIYYMFSASDDGEEAYIGKIAVLK